MVLRQLQKMQRRRRRASEAGLARLLVLLPLLPLDLPKMCLRMLPAPLLPPRKLPILRHRQHLQRQRLPPNWLALAPLARASVVPNGQCPLAGPAYRISVHRLKGWLHRRTAYLHRRPEDRVLHLRRDSARSQRLSESQAKERTAVFHLLAQGMVRTTMVRAR